MTILPARPVIPSRDHKRARRHFLSFERVPMLIVTVNMRPDITFAGIFFLTIVGLALFGCVSLAERLLIPRHISVRRTKA